MAATVDVYVARYCVYCLLAKRLLRRKGVAFREIDVTGDPERRAWLRLQSTQRTVPQIFIDGRSIGGFHELAALDAAGRLDGLLAAAAIEGEGEGGQREGG